MVHSCQIVLATAIGIGTSRYTSECSRDRTVILTNNDIGVELAVTSRTINFPMISIVDHLNWKELAGTPIDWGEPELASH